MEGFGPKSMENLEANLEKARDTVLSRVLFALGIPNIGVANAKMISRFFGGEIERVRHASEDEFAGIDGVGPVMAKAMASWFSEKKNNDVLDDLLREIRIAPEGFPPALEDGTAPDGNLVLGKVFVITGSLSHFKNRREAKEAIELSGGKVTGSVSGKTDYLINNDITSASGKNQTAKKLGIPIITEAELLELLGQPE